MSTSAVTFPLASPSRPTSLSSRRSFYKQEASIVYQLLLTLSTQIHRLHLQQPHSDAALTERYNRPGTLMSAAMFTLSTRRKVNPLMGGGSAGEVLLRRVAVRLYLYFLPGLLFPALIYFNVLTVVRTR